MKTVDDVFETPWTHVYAVDRPTLLEMFSHSVVRRSGVTNTSDVVVRS